MVLRQNGSSDWLTYCVVFNPLEDVWPSLKFLRLSCRDLLTQCAWLSLRVLCLGWGLLSKIALIYGHPHSIDLDAIHGLRDLLLGRLLMHDLRLLDEGWISLSVIKVLDACCCVILSHLNDPRQSLIYFGLLSAEYVLHRGYLLILEVGVLSLKLLRGEDILSWSELQLWVLEAYALALKLLRVEDIMHWSKLRLLA